MKLRPVLLSLLEIKSLYAVNIYKSKEGSKGSQHCCHYTHELQVKAKVVLDESLDLLIGFPRHLDKILHVTILRHKQSIDCPCHWTNPIVPNPPHRDSLNNT